MKSENLTVQIQATAAIPRWAVVNSYGRRADSGDSESEGHILGVTDGAIANTTYGDVTYSGVLFNSDWNWTPGAAIYLNALLLSEVAPVTGFVAQIGNAITPKSIYVHIQGEGGSSTAGPQGSQGAQGNQGAIGSQGSQGAPGAQGAQGFQGATGAQGDQGAQGFQGTQGNQGSQGTQGDQGFQGAQGAAGAQGPQGFQGDAGAQGPQGFQGNQGFQGTQGTQGFQGTQGNQGAQGAQGAAGAQPIIGYQAAQQAITSTSLVNIGGLIASGLASGTYIFSAVLNTNINTGTAGAQFGVQYTGTVTSIDFTTYGSNTGVAPVASRVVAKNTASATMIPSAAEGSVRLAGIIVVSTSGDFSIQALKITSQTLTIRAGSHFELYKVA